MAGIEQFVWLLHGCKATLGFVPCFHDGELLTHHLIDRAGKSGDGKQHIMLRRPGIVWKEELWLTVDGRAAGSVRRQMATTLRRCAIDEAQWV
jgi:hypothetical protein